MAGYQVLDESTYNKTKAEWVHDKCGTVLLAQHVIHPVHDSIWGGAPIGWGEVETEVVPYCPACSKKPSSNGERVLR